MKYNYLSRKKYIKNILSACFLLLCAVGTIALLSGCGNKTYENNTLVLHKDGTVTEYLSEEFPIDLYDIDEWKAECTSQIDECNKALGTEAIKLGNVQLSDSILKCSLDYADDDAYYELNGTAFFYGTISQAIKAGYSLLVPVKSSDDGQVLPSEQLLSMSDSHIVIYSEPVDLIAYKKILYSSDAVTLLPDGKTCSISGEGTGYIVFD